MRNKKGNVLIIALIFIAIIITIFTFVIAVFMGHINATLYNIKLDMYSINRSAIIAVNKVGTSIDRFSYSQKEYEKIFIEILKKNYNLDNELKGEGLIEYIKIMEYEIYERREKDSYTKERHDNRVIHTILEVKMRPIILMGLIDNWFVFTVHEDVNLNTFNEKSG